MKSQRTDLSQVTATVKKKKQDTSILPEPTLSFESFMTYLNKVGDVVSDLKRRYLEEVVRQCEQMSSDISFTTHSDIFALIDETLSEKFDDADASFAIYTSPCGLDLLYSNAALSGASKAHEERDAFVQYLEQYLLNERDLLLTQCYIAVWSYYVGSSCLLMPEVIVPYKSNLTGQQNYFQLQADFRFTTITSDIPPAECRRLIEEIDATGLPADKILLLLKERLPLQGFRFTGFGRIEVTDVTVAHIVKLVTRQVVASNHQSGDFSYMKDVREALTVVAGSTNLQFGVLPLLQLNNKFIFSEHFSGAASFDNLKGPSRGGLFDYLINVYRHKPYRVYLKSISDELAVQYEYLQLLRDGGMQSFALLPVFYHQQFVGVLEVFTDNERDLNISMLTRLEKFFPVLSVIFKKSIETFDQTIQGVIKNKFTALQPSVQWRFNEAAWNYLQDPDAATGAAEIEDIEFNQVYPLYGAIDVKNSTVNRNNALREDVSLHLQLLSQTLTRLQTETSFNLLAEKLFDCQKWQELVDDETWIMQEGELNYFFENEIYHFLKDLSEGKPETAAVIAPYFVVVSDPEGLVCAKRRMLESSMTIIIKAINEEVDQIQQSAQSDFPCFFEKFRTDGVEYDIYIGQSIAPDRAFKHLFIENIRLLQLSNMIAIAKRTKGLQAQLPVPVEITQLIFVQPHCIDIRFRRDEHRFDVEGAYNIRYHIVKKRIDKVLIKNTTERLTAPGKIAIVYFNQKEANEYLVHIHYLQKQRLLLPEIELLELEQLQGVVGLKAIRIAVNHDQ